MRPKPVVLMILDGWGLRRRGDGNAIKLADTPNFDSLWKNKPHCKIKASGKAAGLPKGFEGNSEVGHLNMGAGRVVLQSLVRINKAIKDGSFFENNDFIEAINRCKENNSVLHLMGLIQRKGVHAMTDHCVALLKLCKENNFDNVYVHAFTDGRDTPPKSAKKHMKKLEKGIKKNTGKIATVCGRYYAMDRDNRWTRTELAYNMLVKGKGEKVDNWREAIEKAYEKGETDEFIKPKVIGDFDGVKDGDTIIFFNYRLDRARQITHAFLDKEFEYFKREKRDIIFVAFTEYYDDLSKVEKGRIAFSEIRLNNVLGEVLSENKLTQLRTAETEKYAHVTYFFNGQEEDLFFLEYRKLIHSPKVATYDLKPEMSAYEVKDVVVEAVKKNKYDVIIMNFANGDMVGHTGHLEAAKKACEAVDKCLGKIVEEVEEKGGVVLITADHGNCEEMVGKWKTSHTLNKVPFILVGKDCRVRRKGILADIAPTMLDILEVEKPEEMTGQSLIK